MEALYNRAKLPEHGAQSPDTPRASLQPFGISQRNTQWLMVGTSDLKFERYLAGKLVLFRVERLFLKQTKGIFDLFFNLILSLYQLFASLIYSFEGLMSMCWLLHFMFIQLTTLSLGTLGPCLLSLGSVQFIQQFPPKIPPYFIYSY